MERVHQPQPTPENEHGPGLRPSIYVADLAAYNAGILHGTWIRADGDLERMSRSLLKSLRVVVPVFMQRWTCSGQSRMAV